MVDGSSLAYRAFFALQKNPLRNSKGFNTTGVYLFTNSVLKTLRELRPTHAAVVFDSKKPTFRHQIFARYKAERPKMPDELSAQMPYIREVAEALGLRVIEVPGYEADDVLYTLAKRGLERGFEVWVLTSDKDLLPLVAKGVKILDTRPKDEVLYTPEVVQAKFGVLPERVPDYLALIGDKIDGVPGVKGIGEKAARELINRFGSFEEILRRVDELPGRYKKAIKEHLEDAKLSWELVQLKEVPGLPEPEELELGEVDRAKLLAIFRELEFNSLINQFSEPYASAVKFEELEGKPEGPFAATASPEALVWAREPGKVGFLRWEEAGEALSLPKWTFHAKRVHREALRRGLKVKGVEFDLVIADWLLEPGAELEGVRYKETLEAFAPKYLGLKPSQEPRRRLMEEADLVLRVKDELVKKLKEDELWDLFTEIELPLSEVLAKMELVGIKVDVPYLRQLQAELDSEIKRLLDEIYQLAGVKFNLNSPKQLAHVLFDILKLKPIKKTKTGYSTDQEVLTKLAQEHPLPAKILEYREFFKLKSTYVDALLEQVGPDGRIHPTFHQTGTATGRISCSDPNLQNIPVRTDLGKKIRKAFVAEEGWFLLDADYSQIELRLVAHITGDEAMREAFRRGEDIHTITASRILGKPPEAITPEDRRIAKTVNFGITYGMSPYGLASRLGIPDEEAKAIIEAYFSHYPKVREWIERHVAEATERGYVTTLLGRRRYIPGLKSPNRQVREAARRMAINAPFQGTAADMIKKAMVEIDRELEARGLRSRLLLQVHDELIYEVPEDEVEVMRELVPRMMEDTLPLSVPAVVDVAVGKSWGEVKD